MMFPKPMIFVLISSLAFALIYSSYFSTFWVFAEPSGPIGCVQTGTLKVQCCQEHIINRSPSNPAGTLVQYCTDCDIGPGGIYQNCSERYQPLRPGAKEPTPPPTGPLTPGNLPATTPPLFGETPGGGAEQPPTLTPTQPTPDTGGSTTQPQTPQTVTPEITEDDNEGGGLPTTERNEVPSLDNEITSEEDGQQEDSSEGSETPGPLT